MKTFCRALVIVAAGLMAAAASAQIRTPIWVAYLDNYVTNNSFESGTTDWNLSNSYFEGDEIEYMPLGLVTTDAHSGKYGLDLNLGYGYGYNGFYHSDVRQTLTNTVAVSALAEGSIWAQSSGNTLNMLVTYTDNTQTYGSFYVNSYDATAGNNGFVEWNFLPLLNQSKTIKAIDFYADSFEGGDMTIDDVSLDTIIWIKI